MDSNLKEICNKLSDKLVNTGWMQKLRLFVRSSDFEDIIFVLYHETLDDKRFSPALKDLFRCFEFCHYHELKIVFVYPEPHLDPTLNNGLAISHTQGLRSELGFLAMTEEITATMGACALKDGDLSYWAKKGVLLYNASLTSRVLQPGKHKEIWKPFTQYLFDGLNRDNNLIWVFFGESEHYKKIDNQTHIKLQVPLLPEERNIKWESSNLFPILNDLLVNKQLSPIIW